MEDVIDLYFGNSYSTGSNKQTDAISKRLAENRELLLNQYESGALELRFCEYKNKEEYVACSTNINDLNHNGSSEESDEESEDYYPAILFSTETIDYRLPGDFLLFYNLIHEYDMGSNDFRFVKNIYLDPGIVAAPVEACVNITPLSYTCDEWCVIAEDREKRILIHCNLSSKYYGRLLFHSARDGHGYMSSFYFADFLLIMTDILTKSNSQSIIDYFTHRFDCNQYFRERNNNIFPILSEFIMSDLCHIVLSYIYYEYIPLKKHYVVKTINWESGYMGSHEDHFENKYRTFEEALIDFEQQKKYYDRSSNIRSSNTQSSNTRSSNTQTNERQLYHHGVAIILKHYEKIIEEYNLIRC